MFWTEDRLLWLARMIGLVGFGALVWSGIGGTVMASKSAGWLARRLPRASAFLKGSRLFANHRRFSLIGAALFLAHPIPMLFAPRKTGGLSVSQVLIPFTAHKQTLYTGLGTLAFWTLVVVTLAAIATKKLPRKTWRALHYGVYLFLVIGLAHSLLISAEYRVEAELVDFEEPEKIILLVMGALAALFPLWRVFAARRLNTRKPAPPRTSP